MQSDIGPQQLIGSGTIENLTVANQMIYFKRHRQFHESWFKYGRIVTTDTC